MIEYINEKWSFSADRKTWINCDLPFNVENKSKKDTIYAKRHVRLKPEKDKRYFVTLKNMAGRFKVRINGHNAGANDLLSGDFMFEMTPFIKPANEITIQIGANDCFYAGTILDSAFMKTVKDVMIEKSLTYVFSSENSVLLNQKYWVRSYSSRRKTVRVVTELGDTVNERDELLDSGLNLIEYFIPYDKNKYGEGNSIKTTVFSENEIEDFTDDFFSVNRRNFGREIECHEISILNDILASDKLDGIIMKTRLVFGEKLLKILEEKNIFLNQMIFFDGSNLDVFMITLREYLLRLKKFGVLNEIIFILSEKTECFRFFLEEFAENVCPRIQVKFDIFK